MRAAAARVTVSVLGGVRGAGTQLGLRLCRAGSPSALFPGSRGPLTTLTCKERLQSHLALEKKAVLSATLKAWKGQASSFFNFFSVSIYFPFQNNNNNNVLSFRRTTLIGSLRISFHSYPLAQLMLHSGLLKEGDVAF